jgi:hypothetical protein
MLFLLGTNWVFYIPEDGLLNSYRCENLKILHYMILFSTEYFKYINCTFGTLPRHFCNYIWKLKLVAIGSLNPQWISV